MTPPAVPASLAWAHPLVQEWFVSKFGTPTEPQEQGWPHIIAGRTTLISAPTGSGKTLAAFLSCIDELVRKALAGDLQDRTEVLYVSPLKAPNRIGLSATQKPIEQVAHFLTGSGRPDPVIVDVGHKRKLDLAIEVPGIPLGPITSHEMWDEIYDRISELVLQHRSTLIFVNTRKLAERIAFNLTERLGEDAVAAHHGSLSRKLRLNAERRLKSGELKALVATASLELGIDVGAIDLVCNIGSPRAIAVALQRVGRAGHWRGAIPKGRLFATTRDELIEIAATLRAIDQGELDQLIIPEAPLAILAQQIVAMCSADEWRESQILNLVRRAYPYRNLPEEEFERIMAMLADGIAAQRGRYGAYLHRDRVNGLVRARRGSRMIAVTNGGAIPDTSVFTVIAEPDGVPVGTLDEDFAVESNVGDIMLLGNMSWRIRRVESKGRVLVEDAHGAAPTIPFWRGEAPQRTPELSAQVAHIRQAVHEFIPTSVRADLSRNIDLTLQPGVTDAIAWLKM